MLNTIASMAVFDLEFRMASSYVDCVMSELLNISSTHV